MNKSKGYYQVIDNLVYHAILVIVQALKDDSTNNSIVDIIASRQSEVWNQLDDIVIVCSTTYNIECDEIIIDYTTKLASTMTQHLTTQV